MDFGISRQPTRRSTSRSEKAQLAEACGFTNVWCWDTHILMPEYSPQMTLIAAGTNDAVIGSCVTNPVTRGPTVVASFFATLANMVGGGRLICGIGRGDSAVRIRRARPGNLVALEDSVRIIRGLTRGDEIEIDGHPVRLEWPTAARSVYVAAYGRRPQCRELAQWIRIAVADPISSNSCVERVQEGLREAGVTLPTSASRSRRRATSRGPRRGARPAALVPARVGNHIADMLRHHDPEILPEELRAYVQVTAEYDYRVHTRQAAILRIPAGRARRSFPESGSASERREVHEGARAA